MHCTEIRLSFYIFCIGDERMVSMWVIQGRAGQGKGTIYDRKRGWCKIRISVMLIIIWSTRLVLVFAIINSHHLYIRMYLCVNICTYVYVPTELPTYGWLPLCYFCPFIRFKKLANKEKIEKPFFKIMAIFM